jgi:hypothetical protein
MIKRLAAAAVLFAASLLLALYARDVWHTKRALEDGDTRAALGRVAPSTWHAHTTLPAVLSRGALGIDDDLLFRRTATHALEQVDVEGTTKNAKRRSVIETGLSRIARTDTNAARAALAADYLGVLYYNDPPSPDQAANAYEDPSQAGPSDFQTPEQRATTQFVAAAKLNPADDNAERNLELMLRRPSPPQHHGAPKAGGGERKGNKGSGAREAGHGY